MGIVKKGLTAALITFGFASFANAGIYEAADNSFESKLCVTAATSSKVKMNRLVRHYMPRATTAQMGATYKLIANELYCNGVDVAEFAQQAGNDAIAIKLQKYRTKNVQIRDIAKARYGSVKITN